MLSLLAKFLRLASMAICLIVIASFLIFAVNQTSSASSRQQEAVNSGAPVTASTSASSGAPASSSHESSLHSTIDSLANTLTKPFKGVTSGSSSEWVVHIVDLLLALIVYGFGLGFLARMIRVRV